MVSNTEFLLYFEPPFIVSKAVSQFCSISINDWPTFLSFSFNLFFWGKCSSSNSFLIKNSKSNGIALDNTKCLLYGKKVHEYLTINYDYLYNLNIAATQRLYDKIDTLTTALNAALDRIAILEDLVIKTNKK